MRPYEKSVERSYEADCPSCGCEINYTDVEDTFEVDTCVKVDPDSYYSDIDGYTLWSQHECFIMVHDCCSCAFDRTPSGYIEDNASLDSETIIWGCSKCDKGYYSYPNAKRCCSAEDLPLTAEQLAEQMIAKSS